MSPRILKVDDLRDLTSPEKIAKIFRQLGYNATAEPIEIETLELSARSQEAIAKAFLIADQDRGGLQVVLFELEPSAWESASMASTRMKAIASQLGKRPSEFLLLATKDYNQLMLVNPRKSFDDKMALRASIRKLLIDRQNPTAYDLDRLEAIAVRGKSALELYKAHCDAFDVEKLTKRFYEQYKRLFERVLQVIQDHNPDPYFEDMDRLHQFAQRLLGRIMFLYFLQKKEFLAGDRQFLKTQYRVNKYQADGTDYYAEILEPLFFNVLNTPMDQREIPLNPPWKGGLSDTPPFPRGAGGDQIPLNPPWKGGLQTPPLVRGAGGDRIPYLNGGLFDRDYGVGVRDGAGKATPELITLPNHIFDPGDSESILGFFNGYNFTIAENVAGDEDVAVDPEMLGKVFENMLVAEERGKSGTFYTPRGIVQFMCAEVLARYLVDEAGVSLATAQLLVNYDPDISDRDLHELISPQQARGLKQAIASLKVLDPAVGSGAFPLGMMQLILNVRQAIARREGMTVQRGSLAISEWKREIIANNLYGVDIKPEAIEIAKLRMWLSLVVDIPTIADVEPLPNLDYKLMCGDSLISKINGQTIIPVPGQAEQLSLGFQTTELDRAIAVLVGLEKRYFDVSSEERQGLRLEILAAEKRVFAGAIADQRRVVIQQQQELERELKQLKKPQKKQLQEREVLAALLAGLDEFEAAVQRGDRSLNFFQYYLHFRDVFEEKGGFDLVVGNPPYVRQEQLKEIKPALKAEYDCYTGVADLFVYFYEQGFRLLKPQGYLTYITSNKYFRAGYGEKLRKYLGEKSTIEVVIDFGDANVFEAIAYPSIIALKKADPPKSPLKRGTSNSPLSKGGRGGSDLPKSPLERETSTSSNSPLSKGGRGGSDLPKSPLERETSTSSNSPLSKGGRGGSHQASVLTWDENDGLDDFVPVYQQKKFLLKQSDLKPDGWRLESPEVLRLLDKLRKAGTPLGEYVNGRFYYGIKTGFNEAFVVDRETRDRLIAEHPSSAEVLKPFLRGRDVKRWSVDFAEQYLIKIESSENKEHPWSGKKKVEAEKIFSKTYPAIYQRFNIYKDKLIKRADQGKYFWELRSCAYWEEFETNKIILGRFMNSAVFAFDQEHYLHNDALYMISQVDSFIASILNSLIGWYFLKFICTDLQNGYIQAYRENLFQIPIPKASEEEKQAIEKLVEKCLTAKGIGVQQWEAEIDERVAHLYGLTPADLKIIQSQK
ncbi:Eco57I restriction-modification methylase domain-containing protein [Spirulina major]|uniref:Eco57I restriction-modification methylase domain-containing protein n=1 Tax=Spirulina major TaxID=270636 RepID=UPI0009342C36|nr:Eco57I restriction-modification methylase domain-containing protein [Spirulina major]